MLKTASLTCLVTGGAGFIGCSIAKELVERFGRVVVMDNLHPQIHHRSERPLALHPSVDFVLADVTDSDAWDRLLRDIRPEVVIHLAAETGTGQSLTESERHGRVNVCGTTSMLDAMARADFVPQRFILASSRAVYGEGAWISADGTIQYPKTRTRYMLTENQWDFPSLTSLPSSSKLTWPQPCNVYGATKLGQEHVLAAWCNAFGAEVSILRLQNVYGPGQSLTNSYTGIVSLFCRLARDGQVIPIYEDGAMLRDFVFIDDVASAVILSTQHPVSGAPLDIGNGNASSISDVAKTIAAHYGAPPPSVTGQFRFGDVRHAATSIEGTLLALPNWKPRFKLQDGLPKLIAWVDAQLQSS
jgi:dTDP-L-rhamnose 4-epimerase